MTQGVLILAACGLAAVSSTVFAAEPKPPSHEQLVKLGLKATPEAMEWWRDAKFGIFIHWGVGIEKRHVPWASRTDDVYWDHLFANLKKVKHFDAEKWIQLVKDGGAKYVVFMTRQNGAMHRRPTGNLTLWDSKTTDNKLTHPKSPFRRDVCKEIADACHKLGVELEWYYCGALDEGLWELLTNYGKVRGVWFDGVMPPKDIGAAGVLKKMRKLQPHIVTNGHLGGNKYGGDYGTPQHSYPRGGWAYSPLEIAAILRNGYWYWDLDKSGKSRSVKSLKEAVDLLMGCVGRGHNLALNLAPRPDGSFEPNEVARIKEVGGWLKKYGRSVYATRPGPYLPAGWGVCTRDKTGNIIYLHVLRDLDGGRLTLWPLNAKIVSAALLNDPQAKVIFTQSDKGIEITVPQQHVDKIDTIIALTLDRPAKDAKVVYPTGSVTTGKKATATQTWTWDGVGSTYQRNGPHNAVDGNFASGWCSSGNSPRTLSVDLGKAAAVARAVVSHTETLSAHRKEFQGFRIEYRVRDKWTPVFDSRNLRGNDRRRWHHAARFKPVAARQWRLTVWGGHAFIREFQLYQAP